MGSYPDEGKKNFHRVNAGDSEIFFEPDVNECGMASFGMRRRIRLVLCAILSRRLDGGRGDLGSCSSFRKRSKIRIYLAPV